MQLRLAIMALLFAALATGRTSAQYDPVDPTQTSERMLQEALTNTEAAGNVIIALDEWNLPGWNKVLPGLIQADDANIRIAAAIALADENDADIVLALSRLQERIERSAAITELIKRETIATNTARELLKSSELEPSVEVLLVASCRADTRPDDLPRIQAIHDAPESTVLARGLAASELAERGNPRPLKAWLKSLKDQPEQVRERLLFELALLCRTHRNRETSEALVDFTAGRPSDDLVQATCITSALANRTDNAISSWRTVMEEAPRLGIRGDLALLGLDTDSLATEADLTTLREGPPFHQGLADLLVSPPESRLAASRDLVSRGHLPTMAWVIRTCEDRDDDAAVEAITAVLDASLASNRSGAVDVMVTAANLLAVRNPQAIADRIAEADQPVARANLLRALVRANTEEALAVAQSLPEQPDRSLESIALLARARGELDDAQLRALGRAAAGGGRLPPDLRLVAAWLYLDRSNALDGAIPRIIQP